MTGKRAVALLSLGVFACVPVLKPQLRPVEQAGSIRVDGSRVKAHMKSGELYLLESWRLSEGGRVLEGTGTRFTVLREPRETGSQSLRIEEIALLETSNRETAVSFGSVGLATLTIVWGTLTGVCVSDPKSCFGSCPTFYFEGNENVPRAEGFSESIARALEAKDLDALQDARPRGRTLTLQMRNEALETQAVRSVRLRVASRPPGGRVFATGDGRFHPASRPVPPAECRAPEGDCLAAVAASDGLERWSEADPGDLAAREEVELLFPEPPVRAGIVIGARQTLMTTFLFYQTLAYLGRSAGDWLATLERGGAERARSLMGMGEMLGGIEVDVAEGLGWHRLGSYNEAGPIAGDVQVLALPERSREGPMRVRLRMAKGNWRIGWVAMVELQPPTEAPSVAPARVERGGQEDPAALVALRDEGRYLITQPGDDYRLVFSLPPEVQRPELFLESQGYYYEWMREEWLREEDPTMAAMIFHRPGEALRRLAPDFKAREASAERAFWSSRFRR